MKRRQWNSTLPAPTHPIPRKSRLSPGGTPRTRKPRKPRTASEFNRIYGSRERVAWVKAMPCFVCAGLHPALAITTAGASHNAHTVTGGMGRKAGFETIAPLCASHHRRYDEHKPPFDTEEARQAVKDFAAIVAAAWRAREAA